MTDYIVVGGGMAGMAFAESAWRNGKQIVVYDGLTLGATRVASGLYNAVVLKRLNPVGDADAYLDAMEPFYAGIQARISKKIFFPMPLLRRFASIEEQNDWFVGCDRPELSKLLADQIVHLDGEALDAPFGYGCVNRAGWVDTRLLLDDYWKNLPFRSRYLREPFDYSALKVLDDGVRYKDISARHIVFAEGFALSGNPFFNYLPLQGTKGELLHIHAPGLNLRVVIKGGVFILPAGDDVYKVGATYAWDDKTEIPTTAAREELIGKLNEIIRVPYTVMDQKAGVRPTVNDRKPLLGTHPEFKSVHVFNGLGTRGILLAPRLGQLLYNWIETGAELPANVSINRFLARRGNSQKG